MQITSTGKEFDESRVYIGWRGENRAEQIEFVMPRFYAGTDLLETDCVLELWSKDGCYDEIPLTLEGDTETKALWEPTLAVMSHVGDLYGRLSFVIGEGNVVLKTSQVNFYVRDARDIDGQIEQEYPTELQSLRMRIAAFEAALEDGSLKGEQGKPGVIFTPAVSNGILSWSNDGGLPNPDAVSIKGPQGDRGPQGEQGPKGDKGDKGERGEKGAPFVYEDFTADQIEALKVKGDKGDKGDQGDQGERGAYFTPYVQDDGTLTWRNNGGYANPPDKNIIGPQGEQGIQGEPGPKGEKGDKGEVGATGPAVVPSVDTDGIMSFALQDTPVLPDPVSVRGPQGDTGAVPNITVGTVSTLPPGSSATVTRQEGSTNENPVLDFGLPAGRDGEGSGDMVAAVYDPTNKAQDIFAYADQAEADAKAASVSKAGDTMTGNLNVMQNDIPMTLGHITEDGISGAMVGINVGTYMTPNTFIGTNQMNGLNEIYLMDMGPQPGEENVTVMTYDNTEFSKPIDLVRPGPEEEHKIHISAKGNEKFAIPDASNDMVGASFSSGGLNDAVIAAGAVTVNGVQQDTAVVGQINDSSFSGLIFGNKIYSSNDIDMQTGKIENLGNPTEEQDAATKNYVDTKASAAETNSKAYSIPLTTKGQANGVASLDGTGKVPSAQLPAMNYDPAGSAGAVQTNLDSHIADTVKHVTAAERTDWNSKAAGDHTHTAAQVGARPEDWLPTAAEINAVPTTRTVNGKALSADITLSAADVGGAAASHNQAASTITAGTFPGQVKAGSSGQTYSTYLLRNSRLSASEANPTVNGEICWVYE